MGEFKVKNSFTLEASLSGSSKKGFHFTADHMLDIGAKFGSTLHQWSRHIETKVQRLHQEGPSAEGLVAPSLIEPAVPPVVTAARVDEKKKCSNSTKKSTEAKSHEKGKSGKFNEKKGKSKGKALVVKVLRRNQKRSARGGGLSPLDPPSIKQENPVLATRVKVEPWTRSQ